MLLDDVDALPLPEVVDRIVSLNTHVAHFWSRSAGWAPAEAAALLTKARLDWQVSLSHSLRLWTEPTPTGEDTEARLILAWANLGALVEGTIKVYISVWYHAYKVDAHAIRGRNGQLVDPDGAAFELLRQFLVKKQLLPEWHDWIQHVQHRRNAIHAFRHRELGTFGDVHGSVRKYLEFLLDVDTSLPYP